MTNWTKADDKAAAAEGWGVFDVDQAGLLEIERDDEAELFASDEAALKHVRARAAAGSDLHKRALIRTVTTCAS